MNKNELPLDPQETAQRTSIEDQIPNRAQGIARAQIELLRLVSNAVLDVLNRQSARSQNRNGAIQ